MRTFEFAFHPLRGEFYSETIDVDPNSNFEIRLKSNVSGGFMWYNDHTDKNARYSGVSMEPLPNYMGSWTTFKYKSYNDDAKIRLIYQRSWEDVFATLDITVKIKEFA